MARPVAAAGAEPAGEVATRLRSGTLAEDAAAPGFSFAGVVPGAQRPTDDAEPVEGFTTSSLNTTQQYATAKDDISDEDIQKAIDEIQNAIKKVSK